MTKYILHGGFTRQDNESSRAFYKEFVRDVPEGSNILLVYLASREEDNSKKFEENVESIKRESEGKSFNFLMATQENFLSEIEKSKAVCFYGGSTNKLIKILRTYPDLQPLLEGKTIAGSSAGAYALARFGPSHDEEQIREGLGLVPVRVVCHYESSELPPNEKAVSILEDTAPELELVFLKDCEWKVFTN
ncbi:hypothetical protein A3F55_00080 [Candidatus Adlerbacteria bacterium RIFCSPHIGHO2_12_FULL_53_18]|uniref:Peptidase n=1 Tax=Candidatus Adlerbacteria bacterium RIFCSPHIGHO2_12_FULL_53_18 TaxID=1797242 RepID=A0A1F4XTE3_9BACT|nr:MAG: hypothetical protein A3F55_00080 [Candidatus Adlerbacteria bacterium RIFCSPHIGHO2_12_FULL_53_18]